MIERMRAVAVTLGSALLTLIVISNAYYQKRQFYPSVVYITKSNSSMAIIYLQAFVIVLLMGKLMRKLFFGQLRAAEMEHLIERSWYAVTETCLAFTVFRDDLSPKFVALFTLLLFLKCFHWLAEDRVDYMERSPNISLLFHIRVLSLLLLLGALDIQFVLIAYHITLTKGASVQLVFGFEYAILFTIILNIFIKYLLHRLDLRRDTPWENKAVYLLYTELFMGFLKVVLYLTFITIMMKIHTFPLFAIRPMYLSMRAFKKALNDVIMSRRAIRNMNTLYPNATQEELAAVDNVCIICREEMTGNGSAKKLPCNHIFHVSCLRSWFQRQQTCPTCRMDVLRNTPNANTVNPQQQQQQQAAAAQPQQNRQNQLQLQLPQQMLLFMNLMNALQQQQQQQQQQRSTSVPSTGAQQQQPTQGSASTSQGSTGVSTTTTGSTSITSSTTTTNTASTASTSATLPTFAMSFPFMSMVPPPPPPPPMPPSNLVQLSLDELREMEGNERESLEARIRCLQSIKTLLDAAVTQLNQYNTIVMSSAHRNAPQTTVTNSTTTKPSTSSSSSSSTAPVNQQQQAPPPPPPAATSSKIELNNVNIPSTSNDTEADIIRKRRLERFSQTNAPNMDDLENDNTTQSKQVEEEKKAT